MLMTVLISNVAKPLLLTLSLLGLSAQALAATHDDEARVRATVRGQSAPGAFMRLTA
ncbi:copper chaperone PCu(A)C, partial [Pseudomonas sp. 21(2023)]|nr:copper chaperone PCu(A)C [Pseudomonas sp. 21(2023)]